MRSRRRSGDYFVGAVPFKPPRDRKVKCKAIPCPECGAAEGEPCLTSGGKPKNESHIARRRIAIRKGLYY